MSFFSNLTNRIKSRKAYILYALLALVLIVSLAFMTISKLGDHDAHKIEAAKNGQLKVFDLTSGEEVDVSTILHKKPAIAAEKPAETSKAAIPAMPIKQSDLMFIIDNLGGNKTDTQKAIDLPAQFMLAFSPYAEASLELSESAKAKNHVTLADLPVQSKDSTETPGNLALLIDNNDFKNTRNFEAALSKIYQPSGVLTPPNDLFTHSNNFKPILQLIAQHKIFLAYAGEGEDIDTRAKDSDTGLLKIDLVLNDGDDLAKQLANVETLISKTGLAVVMIKSPSSANIDIIAKWADSLKAKNIHLISSQH